MSMNQVTLVGRLGQDPEVRYFNEKMFVRLSLATTDSGYTTNKGDVAKEETNWHNLALWGAMAGAAKKQLKMGDKVIVTGRLTSFNYSGADGKKHYITEVAVDTFDRIASSKRKEGVTQGTYEDPVDEPQPEE